MMPEIADAAVIAKPDDRWGEVPLAVVILKPGATLDQDELISFCSKHLAKFKCPKEVRIVDTLSHNPSGKILKRVLRSEILQE